MAKHEAALHPAVTTTEVRDFAAKSVQKMLGDYEGISDDELNAAATTLYTALLRLCNRIAWEAKDQAIIDFEASKPSNARARPLRGSARNSRS